MALVRIIRGNRGLIASLLSLTLIGGAALFAEPAFSLTTSVTSVTFTSSSYVQADPNATWTVGFTTTTGPLAAGIGQITISATTTGTAFPGSPGDYTVNKTPVTAAVSGGSTATVTISTPVTIAAATAVKVVITAVTNPSTGTYPAADFTVATTQDTTPVSPSNGLTFYSTNCGATPNCIVAGSPSNFESGDGNMTLGPSGDTDWNCFVGTSQFQSGTAPAGCAVTSNAVGAPSDPNGEIGLVNGQKFDTQCPGLETKNTPPKDDFSNVADFSDGGTVNGTFDTFFYGAVVRSTVNGNASGDVEMNQAASPGPTSQGCRTSGDILIAYDFLNGGTSLSFHVLTWITSLTDTSGGNNENGVSGCYVKSDSPQCWGANVITPNSAQFNGESNQAPDTTASDNGISGSTLSINQFAEFGINLTAALNLPPCKPFAQEVWKSRSSGSSFTSNPEDVEITSEMVNVCAEVKIIKQTDPRGQDQVFNFTSNLPANAGVGGVDASPCTSAGIDGSGNFCLNDTGNTNKTLGSTMGSDNSTGNTVDEKDIPPGTYTVTEGTEPGLFTFESLKCTVTGTPGSSASPMTATSSTETATINLQSGGLVACLYVNKLHSGAVLITKTGKYEDCSGQAAGTGIFETINSVKTQIGICAGPLVGTGTTAYLGGGATFKVTSDSAGNDPVTGGLSLKTSDTTGTVCIDGLSWATGTGTPYYVFETNPPSGYSVDPSNGNPVTATVIQNANCNDPSIATEAALATFNDIPLTDLTVNSQAETAGATNSQITCRDSSSPTPVIKSSAGPSDPATAGPTALEPGTYYCTVVIDP